MGDGTQALTRLANVGLTALILMLCITDGALVLAGPGTLGALQWAVAAMLATCFPVAWCSSLLYDRWVLQRPRFGPEAVLSE